MRSEVVSVGGGGLDQVRGCFQCPEADPMTKLAVAEHEPRK